MRILLKTAIILLFSIPVFGQQAKQFAFKHFSVINGLASNTVSALLQDKRGYIWIATLNGLQRYDGNSFLTFKSKRDDPNTIPSNHIISLFQDRNGNLWLVGDNNRVGIFDTRKFVFREMSLPLEKRKYYIPQWFLELPTGELLLLKDDGNLLKFIDRENKYIPDPDLMPGPPKWVRSKITWDPHIKKYWMSCDSGLVLYDPVTKHLNYRGHNIDNDPVIQSFSNITRPSGVFIDAAGNVLFIHWAPLEGGPTQHRYNRKLKKAESFYMGISGYHEIFSYLQQRNGRLWIYGLPFFAEWKEGPKPFNFLLNEYRNEQSLKFDYPFYAMEDKENNIWIATDNGIFLFNPDTQIFNTYSLVRSNGKPAAEVPVTAVEELDDGKILVGCWNSSGLFCYDKNFNPVPLPSAINSYEHMSVWDMAVHPKTRDLWITLQGGGIAVYSQKAKTYDVFYPEIFGKSTIRQIDEDTSGNLWFGTQSGKLIKWDYKKAGNDPRKGYEFIFQTGRVQKVHYDYQGFIWVSSLGFGLSKIDVRTNKLVRTFSTGGKEGERLFNDSPGDMTYFDDSTLVVSAGCINIINTKTNKVSFITEEEGLPSNSTESLEKDKDGIVWVGMTNGICRLNFSKKLITYYDRRDGIAFDKFSPAGVKELSDGRLVFFTDHNFLVFDPKKFGQETMPPNPVVTGLKVAGVSLSIDSIFDLKRAILKYNNTSIAINFSALTYLQQQKMHYYYMMEGLDKEWVRVDHPNEVVYNYLAPGDYTFRVKSESADGISSRQTATLPITVRSPVWRTWWFYSLIALLVIAILYLLDRERMNKLNSLRDVRRQIRSNLRNEVSNTLNNISVLSEIAKIKADKNIEQAKDFIDQINEKSRHMMEAMDDTLWSIDPSNDSMKKTLLRAKELTEGLRTNTGIEIDLIVDHKVQAIELDMKLRHELYFFYKEAMSFIVQNISCKQVFVNINKVRSKILMEILCECECNSEALKSKFKDAVGNRLKNMPATMDVIADNRSFAVILHFNTR